MNARERVNEPRARKRKGGREGREKKTVQEDERKGRKRDNKGDVAPSRGICPRKRWNSCGRRKAKWRDSEEGERGRREEERKRKKERRIVG